MRKKKLNQYYVSVPNGDHVIVELTREVKALIDFDLWENHLKNFRWYAHQAGRLKTKRWYMVSKEGIRAHSFILGLVGENLTNQTIDHKKHYSFNQKLIDNRISNLRACTSSQNRMNSRKRSDNSSGIPGVYWCKSQNSWRAEIWINYKQIQLGQSKNKLTAIKLRQQAELKYFGEYRNIPTC